MERGNVGSAILFHVNGWKFNVITPERKNKGGKIWEKE